MSDWLLWLWRHPVVALSVGGAVGVNARYWLGLWFRSQPWAGAFPWATVVINLSGSLLLGFLAGVLLTRSTPASEEWYLLLGTGFCGGYTTFSTFELETLRLIRDGRLDLALANVLFSVLLGFAAVVLGAWLATWFVRPNFP